MSQQSTHDMEMAIKASFDEASNSLKTRLVDSSGTTISTSDTTEATQLDILTELESIETKTPSLVSGRVPTESKDINGEGSVTYITNTTPVTGLSARQVVCLNDTVFATFTRTNSTGSITGLTLPAGTLLTGPITAITLTSGAVAAYA
jgi:hypothetical protein